ncbi:unnamed protein product [Strongylus vulgaris]|uniref:SHSP domain-containing protein n=1 Tax=Strongylus vulgaris TaxID=40348 RepID=A0A3P7IVM9_STRVU|nr:unnamed protein product [Strongylus vulgaris]
MMRIRSFVRSWTLPEDANPEALRTELNDKGQLTIEAPKTGTSGSKKNIPIFYHYRSFVRSWTLPEDANPEALRTELNDKGQLTIEAPKIGTSGSKKNIPICPAQRH